MALNEKQKTNLIVVGFIGVMGLAVVLYYQFYFVSGQITSLNRRMDQVKKDIAEKEKDLDQIQKLRGMKDQLEELRGKVDHVKKRLPETPDAPGFLQALVTVLRDTGIIQQSVRPRGTLNRTQYTEIPYSINAYGRFHEVGQFLTFIEQNPDRFMRVKSFKITNNKDRPSIHTIDMQIATFMFNYSPPPPKAEKAGAKGAKKKAGAKK